MKTPDQKPVQPSPVTDLERRRKAEAWADQIPDPEEPPADSAVPVYRDGSPVNECWNSAEEDR